MVASNKICDIIEYHKKMQSKIEDVPDPCSVETSLWLIVESSRLKRGRKDRHQLSNDKSNNNKKTIAMI